MGQVAAAEAAAAAAAEAAAAAVGARCSSAGRARAATPVLAGPRRDCARGAAGLGAETTYRHHHHQHTHLNRGILINRLVNILARYRNLKAPHNRLTNNFL